MIELAFIGAAVALGWWLVQPTYPVYTEGKRLADLPAFFQSLFAVMGEGGIVGMHHEGSRRQFRFRKVFLPDRQHGLRLEIPDVPEAHLYARRAEDMLTAAGFTCTIAEAPAAHWPAQGPVLVAVDQLTAADAFRAAEVTREAMGVAQDDRFTIHVDGGVSRAAAREYRAARSRP